MVGWRRRIIAVAGSLCLAPACADLADLDDDGWYTWNVVARDSVPELCCFTWNRGISAPRECNLDDHRGGFGTNVQTLNDGVGLQLYVYKEAGRVMDIRALSASCPVTSATEIHDISPISGDESLDWLRTNVGSDEDLSDDAILAISLHGGGGINTLIELVRDGSLDMDVRESALFWLVQSDTDEAFAYIDSLLTE